MRELTRRVLLLAADGTVDKVLWEGVPFPATTPPPRGLKVNVETAKLRELAVEYPGRQLVAEWRNWMGTWVRYLTLDGESR